MTVTVFVMSIAIYVLAGLCVSRRVQSSDDFFVMGEKASTLLIVGTLAATYLSAVTMLGIAGISYAEGPLVIAATGAFGAWIGTILAVLYVGRKLKALGCRTMPDFFRDRFQSKAVTVTATIIMIVGLLGYGVIQLIGAGLILSEMMGISFEYVILIFVAALLVFSALGGMYGVVVTDTLMFFSMLAVSLIVAPYLIAQVGFADMKTLSDKLPGYWTIAGANSRPVSFSVSQFFVWVIFFTCTPALVSRVFPAKNDFVLLKAGLIGVFLVALMQIPVFLAATAMQVVQPGIEPTDRVMIVAFLDHLPPVLGGIGLAALMAAIMSTASTLFILAGFGLSRDLYENLRLEPISEKHRLFVGRLAQMFIAIIVALIAISRPIAIYWISVFAGAIFGVGWLPTIIAGLEWKRMNHKAALVSMLVGVVSFIGLKEATRKEWISLPAILDPLMVAFLVGAVSLIMTALLTRPTEGELAYFQKMKSFSPSAKTLADFKNHPEGMTALAQEYQNVLRLIAGLIIMAAIIWGGAFWKLAF